MRSKGCAKTKHGLSRSGLYNCWWDIKRRCYDKRLWCYPLYGGEGKAVIMAHRTRRPTA